MLMTLKGLYGCVRLPAPGTMPAMRPSRFDVDGLDGLRLRLLALAAGAAAAGGRGFVTALGWSCESKKSNQGLCLGR